MHFSIVSILVCGFYTAGFGLDGKIVLTEGQSFVEEHGNYQRLSEGPLRTKRHQGFAVKLTKVQTQYEKQHLIDMSSDIEIYTSGNKVTDGVIKINYPFTYNGISFTYDDDGYSPQIMIQDKNTGKVLVNSFIACWGFIQ